MDTTPTPTMTERASRESWTIPNLRSATPVATIADKSMTDTLPGLSELVAATRAWSRARDDYDEAKNRALYNETASYPQPLDPALKEAVRALGDRYPKAVAYQRAQTYGRASNYLKAGVGRRAMQRLIEETSTSHGQIMEEMETEWTIAAQRAVDNS